jgi:hypothetical protein
MDGFPKWSLCFRFLQKNLYTPLLSPIRARHATMHHSLYNSQDWYMI